jgi:hypothetical protein
MMGDVQDNDASTSNQNDDVVDAKEESRKRALLEQPEEIKPEWLVELPESSQHCCTVVYFLFDSIASVVCRHSLKSPR